MKDESGSVFPEFTTPVGEGPGHVVWDTLKGGLSKRELAAMFAMQGLLAYPTPNDSNFFKEATTETYPKFMAKRALQYADALLSSLNQSEGGG